MPTTVTAIVAGVPYNISDAVLAYRLGDAMTGAADPAYLTEQGPYQHGQTVVGVRLKPRTLQLVLGFDCFSEAEMYDRRAQLLEVFRPYADLTPIQVRFDLANGTSRQIDTHYAGDLTFASSDRDGFSVRAPVKLLAPDPTYYDPTIETVIYGVGGGGSGLPMPMPMPMPLGASTLSSTKPVTYTGTWATYPVIRISGPITDPLIANDTTGAVLDFQGQALAAGQYLIIDTRYGQKTVKDQAGVNRIAWLSDGSDLTSFSLQPKPTAPGGVNTLRAEGSGLTTATEIYIQYYRRFVGF